MPCGCSTTYCSADNGRRPKVSMFSFPLKEPELAKLWLAAIKRKNFTPSVHSRVCELHFRDDQIERVSRFYIKEEGRHLEAPLKYPRLVKGAIPCKFLDRPYLKHENDVSPRLEEQEEIIEIINDCKNEIFSLDDILKNFQKPDPWIIKKTENYISFVYIKEDPLPSVQSIAFINSALELSFYCDNLEVKTLMFADGTSLKFPIMCTVVSVLKLNLAKIASYVETRQKKRGRFVSEDFMVLPYTPFQLRKRKFKAKKT